MKRASFFAIALSTSLLLFSSLFSLPSAAGAKGVSGSEKLTMLSAVAVVAAPAGLPIYTLLSNLAPYLPSFDSFSADSDAVVANPGQSLPQLSWDIDEIPGQFVLTLKNSLSNAVVHALQEQGLEVTLVKVVEVDRAKHFIYKLAPQISQGSVLLPIAHSDIIFKSSGMALGTQGKMLSEPATYKRPMPKKLFLTLSTGDCDMTLPFKGMLQCGNSCCKPKANEGGAGSKGSTTGQSPSTTTPKPQNTGGEEGREGQEEGDPSKEMIEAITAEQLPANLQENLETTLNNPVLMSAAAALLGADGEHALPIPESVSATSTWATTVSFTMPEESTQLSDQWHSMFQHLAQTSGEQTIASNVQTFIHALLGATQTEASTLNNALDQAIQQNRQFQPVATVEENVALESAPNFDTVQDGEEAPQTVPDIDPPSERSNVDTHEIETLVQELR